MLKGNWDVFLPAGLAAGLAVFAYAHQLQIDDFEAYRHSKLIAIEFFFLLASAASSIAVLVVVPVAIYKRQWRRVFMGLVSLVISYLLVSLGLYLDSTTLIYMT